jgi:hypothetical protein
MADENQNEILEENQTEGLMGGVPTEEPKAPDPSETVVPHKEEEKAEDKTYENEKEVKLEKPEYVEDKFWDPKRGVKTEELSNSYSELQKQFSMGKHKAPKEYDISSLDDVEDDDELKSYFLEWAKENKPTQAAFDNLVGKFKELSVQQEEADSINIEEETSKLGPNAQQIIEGVKTWGQGLKAKGVFSDEDFEEFKVFAATANGINTINKLRKYYGEQTIPTAPVDIDGAPSNDDLYELVADPKYKTDPAFRRKVEQQFARAFPGKVNTGEI